MAALVLAFYFWAVAPSGGLFSHFNGDTDYYNLLIKGFHSGHLSLAVETPPGVLKLKDPYDPKQNAPFGMHDVSYYGGKFYLYFGVAPAVTLYGPFHTLTGRYLEDAQALFLFASVGFLAAAFLACAVRRTYFPGLGIAAEAAGVLAVGLATMVPVLLRREQIYEVAVGAADCFFLLSMLGLFVGLHTWRSNRGLAVASLAYGLAIASRPTYVFGGAILLLPVAAEWWAGRKEGGNRKRWRRRALATLGPVTAVVLGLFLYNYGRFGNPLEFGQRLAFSGSDETQVTHFSLSYVGFNCRAYLFAPAQLSTYFPFVRVVWLPKSPPGHFGIEDPYGIFPNVPFVLLALLAPLSCLRRPQLARFAAAVALATLAVAAVIFTFQFATNRYMVDFLPGLIFLAVLGFWGLLDRLAFPARVWAGALGGCLLAWSVLFNVFAAINHNELLRVNDPVVFRRLLHFFDEPRYVVDRLAGKIYGPTEITVRFPTDRQGKLEPIVITGSQFLTDYLYVFYVSADTIVVGFEHSGYGGPVTAPLKVDFKRSHRFLVDLPSLYPPVGDPYFDGIPPRAIEAFNSHLRVSLDGIPLFDSPQLVFPAFRERPLIGTSAPGQASLGERFTGTIEKVTVLKPDWNAMIKAEQSGPMVISLAFPANKVGLHEPLLTSGSQGRGDVLVANYVDATHLTLTLDHWGYGGPTSAPIAIKPGTRQLLEVYFGSFFPADERPADIDASHWAAAAGRLTVLLDHVKVFDVATPFYEAPSATVIVGKNSIGASSSLAEFSGQIFGSYRGQLK